MTQSTDARHIGSPTPECPYLGTFEDRAASYPAVSGAHRCYRRGAGLPIAPAHQQVFCLTPGHIRCPVLLGGTTDHAMQPAGRQWTPWIVSGTLVGIVLVLTAVVLWQMGNTAPTPVRQTAPTTVPLITLSTPMPALATPVPAATSPPTQAATPAPAPPPSPVVIERYRVQSGDTLTAIAAFFGARVEDIVYLNELSPDGFIFVGQELLIPIGGPPPNPSQISR